MRHLNLLLLAATLALTFSVGSTHAAVKGSVREKTVCAHQQKSGGADRYAATSARLVPTPSNVPSAVIPAKTRNVH